MKKVTYSRSYSYANSRAGERPVNRIFAGLLFLGVLLGTSMAKPVFAGDIFITGHPIIAAGGSRGAPSPESKARDPRFIQLDHLFMQRVSYAL